MSIIDILFMAIALAMDCFAVSVTCGIIEKRIVLKRVIFTAFMFGFFQAMMPLLGWLGINSFSSSFQSFDHWIAFGLLGFLGVKMIIDGLKPDNEDKQIDPSKLSTIFTMSIATSIDAFAVGLSFACMGMNSFELILVPIIIIGVVSFLFSFAGYKLGVTFGKRFNIPVEIIGGIILITIGTRILIEHLIMHNI